MKVVYWATALLAIFTVLTLLAGSLASDNNSPSQTEADSFISDDLTGPSTSNGCDSTLVRQQLEEMSAELAIDNPVWNEASFTEQATSGMFAWNQTSKLTPCSFSATVSIQGSTVDRELESAVLEFMYQSGWVDAIAGLANKNISLLETYSLAHAGGPSGNETVFIKVFEDGQMVKFARVRTEVIRERFVEFRSGISNSPCPCETKISLEISAPVKMDDL